MLFWDAPSPKIRHCFESLGQAICQGEIYSHFGPDHVRDRVHNRACSRLQGWQAMSAVKQPDLYFVYKAEDHVSMKLGLALAITLLKLPAVSDADRDLAVSELSGVLHRMEGQ